MVQFSPQTRDQTPWLRHLFYQPICRSLVKSAFASSFLSNRIRELFESRFLVLKAELDPIIHRYPFCIPGAINAGMPSDNTAALRKPGLCVGALCEPDESAVDAPSNDA